MRVGGSSAKGAEFERKVATRLSLWLTEGARADLFTRNVLSGGRFTRMGGEGDAGLPGDLLASHPLAYEFLTYFVVECKHYQDLGIEAFLFDQKRSSFLWQVFEKTQAQAAQIGAEPFVIALQNRKKPILLCPPPVLVAARSSGTKLSRLRYHLLHEERIGWTGLEEFIDNVRPKRFMGRITQSKPR